MPSFPPLLLAMLVMLAPLTGCLDLDGSSVTRRHSSRDLAWMEPGLWEAFPAPGEQGNFTIEHEPAERGFTLRNASLGGAWEPLNASLYLIEWRPDDWRFIPMDAGSEPQPEGCRTTLRAPDRLVAECTATTDAETVRATFDAAVGPLGAPQEYVDAWYDQFLASKHGGGSNDWPVHRFALTLPGVPDVTPLVDQLAPRMTEQEVRNLSRLVLGSEEATLYFDLPVKRAVRPGAPGQVHLSITVDPLDRVGVEHGHRWAAPPEGATREAADTLEGFRALGLPHAQLEAGNVTETFPSVERRD